MSGCWNGGGGGVERGRHRAEADRRGRGGYTTLIGEGKLGGTRRGETCEGDTERERAAGERHGHARGLGASDANCCCWTEYFYMF